MQIDPEDMRRHYESLSDEALLAVDRSELIPVAQKYYDAEVAGRELTHPPKNEGAARPEEPAHSRKPLGEFAAMEPDWIEDAACACAFTSSPAGTSASDAETARVVLEAAGLPCQVKVHEEIDPPDPHPQPRDVYQVMVPGALNLLATSVLDREIFNPQLEAEWRTHFEALSDEELHALNAEVICAGLVDRVERLTRAHRDEIARRRLNH